MPTYNYGNQENEDTELKKRLNQTAFQQAESGAPLESDTVRQAQELLKQQSATPGKTSGWQNQLNDTINRILNREQFSYDLNGDALYQQYKDNYMTQGKMAMMDTMGQAQAMTGGYGNSYAQGVGQQAYHGYLQQLNDRVPELYQLALSKYQMDGDQLYDRAGMLSQMDRYQKADEQWQKEFDEAKLRYDMEWEQKYGTKPDRGEGGDGGAGGGGNGGADTGTQNTGSPKTGKKTSADTSIIERAQAFIGVDSTGKWDAASKAKAKAMGYDSLEEVIADIQGRYNPGTNVSPNSGGGVDDAYNNAVKQMNAIGASNNIINGAMTYSEWLGNRSAYKAFGTGDASVMNYDSYQEYIADYVQYAKAQNK